jgi:ATP-dependent helicase/nuclease subunit B
VIQAYLKKDGQLGKNSDGMDAASFAAVLRLVETRIGELTDDILDGEIAVRPYRVGTVTPCPNCEFRSVCRFDSSAQPYRNLESLSKEQVIERALNPAGEKGAIDD